MNETLADLLWWNLSLLPPGRFSEHDVHRVLGDALGVAFELDERDHEGQVVIVGSPSWGYFIELCRHEGVWAYEVLPRVKKVQHDGADGWDAWPLEAP